jgi:hypothetical protein
MRSRSRPNHTKEASGPNGPQAERAAVEAEEALRLAAARRAERDAASLESLAAEIEERERALEAREALIRALENRLEDSRRRLEERIEEMRERRPVTTGVYLSGPAFNVPSIDEAYFDAGSNADEDAWWSRQLGKPPRLAA